MQIALRVAADRNRWLLWADCGPEPMLPGGCAVGLVVAAVESHTGCPSQHSSVLLASTMSVIVFDGFAGGQLERIGHRSLPAQLPFITGLRGVAALVVAVGHTWGMVGPDHPGGPVWKSDLEHLLLWPWQFGKPMVWLFILVSGFALYWSEEARRSTGRTATTLRAYAWKRVWRILPTYYVSLALGLLAVLGLGWWLAVPSPSLQTYGPVTLWGVLSHLLLVQNLNLAWMYQANPPLWSIAVEAQLYLLFPVLLWAARKWNVYVAALALVVVPVMLNVVSHVPVFSLSYWFMLGAVLAHVARRFALNWRLLFSVSAVSLAVGFSRPPFLAGRGEELVWLIGFAALVLALVQTGCGPLGWPLTQWLGERSFSLYAVHFPVALVVWGLVSRLGFTRPAEVAVTIFLGIAASTALAHWCYRLVEAPSMKIARGRGNAQTGGLQERHPSTQLPSSLTDPKRR